MTSGRDWDPKHPPREIWGSQEAARTQLSAARPYCDRHAHEYAGRWLEWEGRTAVPVIAFVADLERHRAALDPAILIVQRRWSERELLALREPAIALVNSIAGAQVNGSGVQGERNRLKLRVSADEMDALRRAVADRFGDAVHLVARGPLRAGRERAPGA